MKLTGQLSCFQMKNAFKKISFFFADVFDYNNREICSSLDHALLMHAKTTEMI